MTVALPKWYYVLLVLALLHMISCRTGSEFRQSYFGADTCPVSCPKGLGDPSSPDCSLTTPPAGLEVFSSGRGTADRSWTAVSSHICLNSSQLSLSSQQQETKLSKFFILDKNSGPFKGVATFIRFFAEELEKRSWQVVYPPEGLVGSKIDEWLKSQNGGKFPDVLAFYILRNELLDRWPTLFQLSSLRVLLVEDIDFEHDISPLQRTYQDMDVIFTRYPEHTMSFIDRDKVRSCYVFPHGASKYFFAPETDGRKIEKVLLSGSLFAGRYPLRDAADALEKIGDRGVVRFNHPGYDSSVDSIKTVTDYAKVLGQHRIAIAGGPYENRVKGPYLIAKHFEVGAAGSVVMVDEKYAPFLEEQGFVANAHFITARPKNLERRISYWLAPGRKVQLERIALQAQELVRRCHTLEQRADLFDSTVRKEFFAKTN